MENQKLLENHVRKIRVDEYGKVWMHLKNGISISFKDDDIKETSIHVLGMDNEETLSVYIHDDDEVDVRNYDTSGFSTVNFKKKKHIGER